MKLTKKEQKALQEFTKALTSKHADRIDKIILYGSKARGDFHPESDIDVLVVVKDKEPRIIDKYGLERVTGWGNYPVEETAFDRSFELLFKHGAYITPFVVDVERFSRWNPFFNTVKKEGKVLWQQ